MDNKKTSVFISLILRHKPETIGIALDKYGWADVQELIDGINRTQKYSINRQILEEIVRTDHKQRYSFNEDKTRIRANQGHSICVDVELKEVVPPEYLYHGTAERFVDSINTEGLKPQSRLYVHLSKDTATAVQVGSRHGKPVIYQIFSGDMYRQGYIFYLSENGVWLTKHVPVDFMTILKTEA